jgi:hypothetical protein
LQGVFQHSNIFVKSSEEGFDLSGDVYGASHPLGRLCGTNRMADGSPPNNLRLATAGHGRNSFQPSLPVANGQVRRL